MQKFKSSLQKVSDPSVNNAIKLQKKLDNITIIVTLVKKLYRKNAPFLTNEGIPSSFESLIDEYIQIPFMSLNSLTNFIKIYLEEKNEADKKVLQDYVNELGPERDKLRKRVNFIYAVMDVFLINLDAQHAAEKRQVLLPILENLSKQYDVIQSIKNKLVTFSIGESNNYSYFIKSYQDQLFKIFNDHNPKKGNEFVEGLIKIIEDSLPSSSINENDNDNNNTIPKSEKLEAEQLEAQQSRGVMESMNACSKYFDQFPEINQDNIQLVWDIAGACHNVIESRRQGDTANSEFDKEYTPTLTQSRFKKYKLSEMIKALESNQNLTQATNPVFGKSLTG